VGLTGAFPAKPSAGHTIFTLVALIVVIALALAQALAWLARASHWGADVDSKDR